MRLSYRIHQIAVRIAIWVWGGGVVHGLRHVPVAGPLIVASNHASYLDPPLVGGVLPRECSFMARETLFKNWLFAWWIRHLNAFPIKREGDSREALREFSRRMDEGRAVLMFPEGTRTVTGRLGHIRPGVGTIATRTGAPVLPVYIWGAYHSWPRGQKLPRRHRVKIYFAEPILTPAGLRGAERKAAQQRVQEELAVALHSLEEIAWEDEAPPVPLQLAEEASQSPDSNSSLAASESDG